MWRLDSLPRSLHKMAQIHHGSVQKRQCNFWLMTIQTEPVAQSQLDLEHRGIGTQSCCLLSPFWFSGCGKPGSLKVREQRSTAGLIWAGLAHKQIYVDWLGHMTGIGSGFEVQHWTKWRKKLGKFLQRQRLHRGRLTSAPTGRTSVKSSRWRGALLLRRYVGLFWACTFQYLPVSSNYPWRHCFVSVQSVHGGTPDSVNGSTDIRLLLFFRTPRSTALAVCCSSLANKANFYSKNGCRLLQSWATHTHPTHY